MKKFANDLDPLDAEDISLPITLTLRPAVYPQGPEDLFLKKKFNVLTIFFSFGFRDNARFLRDVFHGLDRK